MKPIRQGDLDIFKISEMPKSIKSFSKGVVAHGESGNTHKLNLDVEVFEDDKGVKYFNLPKEAVLNHEQHKPITLEQGMYKVIIETERDPYTRALRAVRD